MAGSGVRRDEMIRKWSVTISGTIDGSEEDLIRASKEGPETILLNMILHAIRSEEAEEQISAEMKPFGSAVLIIGHN